MYVLISLLVFGYAIFVVLVTTLSFMQHFGFSIVGARSCYQKLRGMEGSDVVESQTAVFSKV